MERYHVSAIRDESGKVIERSTNCWIECGRSSTGLCGWWGKIESEAIRQPGEYSIELKDGEERSIIVSTVSVRSPGPTRIEFTGSGDPNL